MVEDPKIPAPGASPQADAEAQPALDAAGQSLAHALRTSFKILTLVIFLLVILFLSQGFFTVQAGDKAIVLRFGRTDTSLVKSQGLHYALPYPIDEVITIPVRPRTMEVNTFWSKVTEEARQSAVEKGEQNLLFVEGAEDAFMLTGDLNVLQARWQVTYRIADDPQSMIRYFNTLGDIDNNRDDTDVATDGSTGSSSPMNTVPTSERILMRALLQNAVISTISHLKVFDAYPRGTTELTSLVHSEMAKTLAVLDCGLTIQEVNLTDIRPPTDVKPSFDAVLEAQQQASQMSSDAGRDASQILIDAAGDVGPELGKEIRVWWDARLAGQTDAMQASEARLHEMFTKATGKSLSIMASAQAYKTRIAEEAKADASAIESLLRNPDADVKIFLQYARIEALQDVLENCYEKFLYKPAPEGTNSTLEVWLNRRAELLRAKKQLDEQKSR